MRVYKESVKWEQNNPLSSKNLSFNVEITELTKKKMIFTILYIVLYGRISRCISIISRAAGAKVVATELREQSFHCEVQQIMNSHQATHLT